jgi:hypothetical protein
MKKIWVMETLEDPEPRYPATEIFMTSQPYHSVPFGVSLFHPPKTEEGSIYKDLLFKMWP